MPTAILSVYDKTGIIELPRDSHPLVGCCWLRAALPASCEKNGITVTEVAEYTKSPEILGGRVKNFAPGHSRWIACPPDGCRSQGLFDLGWDYIDLVALNLYPFEATIAKPNVAYDEVIENIDIGGVTLIRAAAKNHDGSSCLRSGGLRRRVFRS